MENLLLINFVYFVFVCSYFFIIIIYFLKYIPFLVILKGELKRGKICLDYDFESNNLKINIIEATDLPAMDIS